MRSDYNEFLGEWEDWRLEHPLAPTKARIPGRNFNALKRLGTFKDPTDSDRVIELELTYFDKRSVGCTRRALVALDEPGETFVAFSWEELERWVFGGGESDAGSSDGGADDDDDPG